MRPLPPWSDDSCRHLALSELSHPQSSCLFLRVPPPHPTRTHQLNGVGADIERSSQGNVVEATSPSLAPNCTGTPESIVRCFVRSSEADLRASGRTVFNQSFNGIDIERTFSLNHGVTVVVARATHYGLPVRYAKGAFTVKSGELVAFSGQLFEETAGLRRRGARARRSFATPVVAGSLAQQPSTRTMFDPRVDGAVTLLRDPGSRGRIEIRHSTGASRTLPPSAFHQTLRRQTTSAVECDGNYQSCDPISFFNDEVEFLRFDSSQLNSLPPGDCKWVFGNQIGSRDVPHTIRRDYVVNGWDTGLDTDVTFTDACSASIVPDPTAINPDFADAHFWASDVTTWLRTATTHGWERNGVLTDRLTQINVTDSVSGFCGSSSFCVIDVFGDPYDMQLKASEYDANVISHEFGHVLHLMAGYNPWDDLPDDVIGGIFALGDPEAALVRRGYYKLSAIEGLADAVAAQWDVHRFLRRTDPMFSYDSVPPLRAETPAITRPHEAMRGVDASGSDAYPTLFGTYYPIPDRADNQGLFRVSQELGAGPDVTSVVMKYGRLIGRGCSTGGRYGDTYYCGSLLSQLYWDLVWNRYPHDFGVRKADEPILTAISATPGTNPANPISYINANEALTFATIEAVSAGKFDIYELLKQFIRFYDLNRTALGLSASDITRLHDLARSRCINPSTGGQLTACNNHLPTVGLSFVDSKRSTFSDPDHPSVVTVPKPNSLFGVEFEIAEHQIEEVIPASDMTYAYFASKGSVQRNVHVSHPTDPFETIYMQGSSNQPGHLATIAFERDLPVTVSSGKQEFEVYVAHQVQHFQSSNGFTAYRRLPVRVRIRIIAADGTVLWNRETELRSWNVNLNPARFPSAGSWSIDSLRVRVPSYPGTEKFEMDVFVPPTSAQVPIDFQMSVSAVLLRTAQCQVSSPGGPDRDGDGIPDACDLTPCLADTDADGVCDPDDSCVDRANSGQRDVDGDGEGDACDPCWREATLTSGSDRSGLSDPDDQDHDGICDDSCPTTPNRHRDRDSDGTDDACDSDLDGDGLHNDIDLCVFEPSPIHGTQHADQDGDGWGDECDCAPSDPWNQAKSCQPVLDRADIRAGYDEVLWIHSRLAGVISKLEEYSVISEWFDWTMFPNGCTAWWCDGDVFDAAAFDTETYIEEALPGLPLGVNELTEIIAGSEPRAPLNQISLEVMELIQRGGMGVPRVPRVP